MSKPPGKEKEFSLFKLKSLLGLKNSGPSPPEYYAKGKPEDYVPSIEILKEISSGSPPSQRIKAMKRISEDMQGKKLHTQTLETIWFNIEDLAQFPQPKPVKAAIFEFIGNVIKTQYDNLGFLRVKFFEVVCNSETDEDFNEKIALARLLTQNGREIVDLEEKIGQFVYKLASPAFQSNSVYEFLDMLINLIKLNSSYLDKQTINHVISLISQFMCKAVNIDGVIMSLQVYEVIVSFSWVPTESLECLLSSLCCWSGVKPVSRQALKIARNVMGSHIGHSGLYTLCKIMSSTKNKDNLLTLRGAIFFTGMFVWGSFTISSLKLANTLVLTCYLNALEENYCSIANEVFVSVRRLLKKYGKDLDQTVWNLVMEIMEVIVKQCIDNANGDCVRSIKFREILAEIEHLIDSRQFKGCEKRFFAIIEKCSSFQPETSVLRLLIFKASFITSLTADWLSSFNELIDKFYKHETRTVIRLKVLQIISEFYKDYHNYYGNELAEKIILPCFDDLENECDVTVNNATVDLLIFIAQDCDSKICLDIVDILSKVVDRIRLDAKKESPETIHVITDKEIQDIRWCILGLIKLFEKKIYEWPPSVAIKIFMVLVKHLELHYDSSILLRDVGCLRRAVFDCLLKLRSNDQREIGMLNSSGEVQYSPHLHCNRGDKITEASSVAESSLSIERFLLVLIHCLGMEKDWPVLQNVLLGLRKLLQNKTFLLSSPHCIENLGSAVCSLIGKQSLQLPESLRNCEPPLTKADFQAYVFSIQVALTSYDKYMDKQLKKLLVVSLKRGIPTKCASICIAGLAVCNLEMGEVMLGELADVLLILSKISATVNIATSILEFLSTLACFPRLYSSFTQKQYMSIFAIAVSYTNPFKFNHYVVSLAYYVISLWFVKCRISYRRGFVSFIIKTLKNIVPFPKPDTLVKTDVVSGIAGAAKVDWPVVKSEITPNSKECLLGNKDGTSNNKPGNSDRLLTFHRDMIETFVDFLNRYTFSDESTSPKRTPIGEFLLNSGNACTWLLGNSIITITTSGCGRAALSKSNAVFDKGGDLRRRHHSAAVEAKVRRSLSVDSDKSEIQSQDDLEILKLLKKENISGPQACNCWCQEFAEVYIRRPTGNVSWILKLQNSDQINGNDDFSFADVSDLIYENYQQRQNFKTGHDTNLELYSKFPEKHITRFGHERIDSESLDEKEHEAFIQDVLGGKIDISSSEEHSIEKVTIDKDCSISCSNTDGGGKTDMAVEAQKEPNFENINVPVLENEPKISSPEAKSVSNRIHLNSDSRNPKLSLPLKSFVRDNNTKSRMSLLKTANDQGTRMASTSLTTDTESLQPFPRDRCNTIAVMSPARDKVFKAEDGLQLSSKDSSLSSLVGSKCTQTHGLDPRFVFLQLYNSFRFGVSTEEPIFIKSQVLDRSLVVLDHILPFENHKFGVLYVGVGQAESEVEILANEFGSVRYFKFVHGLGNLIRLKDLDAKNIYVGGLELLGRDGKFVYVWKDDLMQAVFHVATMLPNKENDPANVGKKVHIGNDYVTIVYNDSRKDYNLHTIKGQCTYACIIIHPLDHNSNLVILKTVPDLNEFMGTYEPKIISEDHLPILVRQLAVHANLAIKILLSKQRSSPDPHASNWLERLRQIRRIRDKRLAETPPTTNYGLSSPVNPEASQNQDDFTNFT